jgi:hypothetical protein
MLNSEPIETEPNTVDARVLPTPSQDIPSQHTPSGGSTGAVALAGLATLVVVAIWFAFYLLVFVPRAGAP